MIMENLDIEPKGPENTTNKKRRKYRFYSIISVGLILILSACNCPNVRYIGKYTFDVISRKDLYLRTIDNPNWAEKLELEGVPNFHKVSDELYRGAQPTREGMQELKNLGIKTIVNLRSEHSDEKELEGIDISYEYIGATPINLDSNDVISFLKIVSDSNNTPVFVHCRHGADRTGTMCAFYRIAVEDWTKDEAIEEMTKGGFGFHSIWSNLLDFIQKSDIEGIKQGAGLPENDDKIVPISIQD